MSGRSPGGRLGNPLQYSSPENPMDRGAWQATYSSWGRRVRHDWTNWVHTHVSVQFSRSVMSDSSRPHELQHARPPCPSPTPGVHSNSCTLSRWCHPAISSSVVPFSSCPQSLPASESFPMSQLFARGGQSTGVSALASFLPKNTQDCIYRHKYNIEYITHTEHKYIKIKLKNTNTYTFFSYCPKWVWSCLLSYLRVLLEIRSCLIRVWPAVCGQHPAPVRITYCLTIVLVPHWVVFSTQMMKIVDCGLPVWCPWLAFMGHISAVALPFCPLELLMILHKMSEGQWSPSTMVPPHCLQRQPMSSTLVHPWIIHLPTSAWQQLAIFYQ